MITIFLIVLSLIVLSLLEAVDALQPSLLSAIVCR